jgi:CRP-like cAMP-binding protein
MSRRLREADAQINNLALLDVRGRIAHVLMRLSRGKETEQSEQLRKIPRPSTKEIAAMSGTSRETVSRILSDFSKRGMIGLTKKNIYIFNTLEENIDFQ